MDSLNNDSFRIKKILRVDLEKQKSVTGNFTDLNKYIGGVAVGLKLMETYYDNDPLIFSVGPLNGFFPYASKTAVVVNDGGVIEDLYFGGTLSTRLKFTGLDAIVLENKSNDWVILEINNTEVNFLPYDTDLGTLGLPGKRSVIELTKTKALLDNNFVTPEYIFEEKLLQKKIRAIVITGTETYKLKDFDRYQKLYKHILNRRKFMTIGESNKPSCINCPMGCEKASVGEIGGNIILHSLVACKYSEKIYNDLGITFSCLNSLGYNYTHEDIENLPKLVEETMRVLS